MMRCGQSLGVLNREVPEICLMYSPEESSFSKEYLREINKGKFIKE